MSPMNIPEGGLELPDDEDERDALFAGGESHFNLFLLVEKAFQEMSKTIKTSTTHHIALKALQNCTAPSPSRQCQEKALQPFHGQDKLHSHVSKS